ncbi:restriction endonuclease [Variovorax sp. PCZ-1]|uniref:restriction endonuclease n=1 Tax=Variovorax sp. PCZ-1 TaxID=2835533 RepID=UPI001BCAFD89|nr:restriction endonuclease [Variovorax sp. PCZ-1]MBS7807073.1 restriction endonuclease [Variovorax sp. PCZ-1]
MKRFPAVSTITPSQFELLVKKWLSSTGHTLDHFKTAHLDQIQGLDGEYTFDVTARFKALGGADFLVIVECKKHKNPIKREVLQALHDKQQAVGAHKAMVVATSDFQSGAIEYASAHKIALVQIINGQAAYIMNSASGREIYIPDDADDYVGFFYAANPSGELIFPQLLSSRMPFEMEKFLEQPG